MNRILLIIVAAGLLAASEVPTEAAWGREPRTGLTATRGEVVLNGLWRFADATGGVAAPAWGSAVVPGSWANSEEWYGAPLGHLVAPGGGAWDGEAGKRIFRALYE